jgi:hypothetical protein
MDAGGGSSLLRINDWREGESKAVSNQQLALGNELLGLRESVGGAKSTVSPSFTLDILLYF